jgi:hypothetical protein
VIAFSASLRRRGPLTACAFFRPALGALLGTQVASAEDKPVVEAAPNGEEREEKSAFHPSENLNLPDVPGGQLAAHSPQPSWDTGLLLGVCGVGNERAWQVTKFCIGGLIDMMFLREQEDETGLGGYLALGSAGFRDVRVSGGVTSVVSLIDWFSLSLRGGGLGVLTSQGVQPGVEGYIGLGHRSVSLSSRYALSHSFFAGMQYALKSSGLPASHAIWVGLQIDGVWLTAPRGLLRKRRVDGQP